MDLTSVSLLTSVLSLPTMTFHEAAVATFIRFYAMGLGLLVHEDHAGNLLISYRGGKRGGITFAAHMDHPGFEVIKVEKRDVAVALWGKVNPKTFAGSKVVVYTATGTFKGKIGSKTLPKKHLGRFCFKLHTKASVNTYDFGHYDLPDIKLNGDRIITRAADNLVSVAAILDLLARLRASRAHVNVSGLFTRSEEAAFLGAFAAMEGNFIPKRNPLIVLECSSAAGGNVSLGEGPVIRAGDLQSTYDPAVDVWVSDVASKLKIQKTKNRKKDFQFQRALLQGGRCEACVYVAEGYRTGGIALPLGNYHNQGPKGPAAEFVSQTDYTNLLTLITALAFNPMPPKTLHTKVAPLWKHYRSLKQKFLASR